MITWPAGLDPAAFIERHWQKSPALLTGALPGFNPPISPEELAGLACEPDVEARIVCGNPESGWTLRHGPFTEDDFLDLPETDWTLLVQDVEKHLTSLKGLLSLVSFLPAWRSDDLMISYAAAGGSVGPHLDAYDVFLIQGQGSRTWAIDPRPSDIRWRTDCELRVLERFHARQEFRLTRGDILYVPPGVAHFGIGEEPAMTFSIGFRAPTASGLLSEAGRALEEDGDMFYEDPDLSIDEVSGGRISDRALARARDVVERAASRAVAGVAEHLGRAATRGKPWLTPLPPDDIGSPAEVARSLTDGARFRPHAAARLAWCVGERNVWLFCDGEAWPLPVQAADFCDALCRSTGSTVADLAPPVQDCHDLLCELVLRGSLELIGESAS